MWLLKMVWMVVVLVLLVLVLRVLLPILLHLFLPVVLSSPPTTTTSLHLLPKNDAGHAIFCTFSCSTTKTTAQWKWENVFCVELSRATFQVHSLVLHNLVCWSMNPTLPVPLLYDPTRAVHPVHPVHSVQSPQPVAIAEWTLLCVLIF